MSDYKTTSGGLIAAHLHQKTGMARKQRGVDHVQKKTSAILVFQAGQIPILPVRAGIVAILLLFALIIAACGGDPDPTPVPPTATAAPEPTATATPEPEPKSIVDIATEDGRFQTLVAALGAAGLAETLAADGPFTVFAPHRTTPSPGCPQAPSMHCSLDIPALTEILLYHVVSGNVLAADIVDLDSATTLQGDSVDITVDGTSVLINDARVVITDIQAANGHHPRHRLRTLASA